VFEKSEIYFGRYMLRGTQCKQLYNEGVAWSFLKVYNFITDIPAGSERIL